ncbi:ergothioneine biosynthesis protein EgtB [Puia dinghuensis]|uniref:Ergothioneine biosynthesis protein EgtB n=1 Tax=Puia dinghuensis TaxID=1792502 RepID=A0A8J2UEH7_9BACT|nr:ergothioneine biosynthesis protein EgtB [Puia dinghuensis]GGB06898.1 ergothioneine biosynthesis protein EgtB [Puia dinghuensis]
MTLLEQYRAVRKASEAICQPLQKEDYVVQPIVDVSPPKWHLGHTTWFWEAFVLIPHHPGYKPCNPDYNYVFNSYYETIGARVVRTDRGNLSRPSVDEIYSYRQYVDEAMLRLIADGPGEQLEQIIVLGLNHEQQHQELLFTDIKYILGHNPLFPAWSDRDIDVVPSAGAGSNGFVSVPAGLYEIGYEGDGFCFDNELSRHKVYLEGFQVAATPVTNEEYLEFIEAGGYQNFVWWHAEGWDWVKKNAISSPMYWHLIDGRWHQYTMAGLRPLDGKQLLSHISYYEAVAYAAWKGCRLPTEFEWEASAGKFGWGQRWEWTESAYLPYPGFKKAEGAIGEYNGKFMVSQMVLRGASVATPAGHSRKSYRNFFQPYLRWQFTGIRIAK